MQITIYYMYIYIIYMLDAVCCKICISVYQIQICYLIRTIIYTWSTFLFYTWCIILFYIPDPYFCFILDSEVSLYQIYSSYLNLFQIVILYPIHIFILYQIQIILQQIRILCWIQIVLCWSKFLFYT